MYPAPFFLNSTTRPSGRPPAMTIFHRVLLSSTGPEGAAALFDEAQPADRSGAAPRSRAEIAKRMTCFMQSPLHRCARQGQGRAWGAATLRGPPESRGRRLGVSYL